MAGIVDEIKRYFNEGDATARLILINLGVYVAYLMVAIFSGLFQANWSSYFIDWTALPSDLGKLVFRPWTVISYMFLHQGFMHIFFNMLWLYFSGRIFTEYMGGKRLIATYLLGGLIGGALYVISYNVFPGLTEFAAISNNRGASAGVMAIVLAAATYAPNLRVRLFFVLDLKLWMIAALALLSDLIYLGDGNNIGGHIAHLGGAAFGYLMARQLQNGRDITEGFNGFMDNVVNLFKPKPNVKKVYTNKSSRSKSTAIDNQDKMDAILDKISKSGYDSLSKEEKDYLFKIGKE